MGANDQGFQIESEQVAGFASDHALAYVPNAMGFGHVPCGTHALDLSLEDNYLTCIKEEVDKFVKIRQYLTATTSVGQEYTRCQEKHCDTIKSFPINSMVRFVTHEDAFNHIKIFWRACNETLESNGQGSLILKESEVQTSEGCSMIFEMVRHAMKELQGSMCCKYLPILYGLILKLEKLKSNHPNLFVAATGQELFRVGVMASISKRVGGEGEDKQLTLATRKCLVKAMLMEPYLKCKIDVKTGGLELSKVFPRWIRSRFNEECKKELVKECEHLIQQSIVGTGTVEDGDSSSDEEPKKKKKKKNEHAESMLEFLEDEGDMTRDSEKKKVNDELEWFKKKYLESDIGVNSIEASEIYWQDRRKKYPNVIKLLCKYRSIACTSIFEEECFSQIKKIVTEDRESLKDTTIEGMMFFKKNYLHFPQ